MSTGPIQRLRGEGKAHIELWWNYGLMYENNILLWSLGSEKDCGCFFVFFLVFSISVAPLTAWLFKSFKIAPLLYWRLLYGILSCPLTKRNIKGGKE